MLPALSLLTQSPAAQSARSAHDHVDPLHAGPAAGEAPDGPRARRVGPVEQVVAGLEVASGVLLAVVGGYLLRRAVLRRRAARASLAGAHGHDHHEHGHDGHEHDGHEHDGHEHHESGHAHSSSVPQPVTVAAGAVLTHPTPPGVTPTGATPTDVVIDHDHGLGRHTHVLPDPARPLGARSLAAMGVAGGLVPSPSALVVLLGASAIGRTWWGVLLVVAYGVGMALTLTLAGLALLRVQRLVSAPRDGGTSRWSRLVVPTGLLTLLPLLTAGIIILVGCGLVLRGLLLSWSFG